MADYTPPQGVQDEAAKAVEWIAEGLAGDGFTATGRRRAQQLADGVAVSEDVVRRMASYFARHEPDTEAEGFNYGEPGYPTPGRVAWSAWGGDPGRTWAESTLSSLDSEDERGTSTQMTDETRELPETIYPVTARQQAMYDATEGVAELFGKFDQGVGPDGAHYVAESPFDGMVCSSCLFYDGARACEVVDGDIAPEAVCKLWIIPEALLPGSESEGTDQAVMAAASTEGEQMREHLAATEIGRRALDREREHRGFASVELDEVRESAGALTFRGYASVFNAPYDVAGLFTEEVAPTAFNRTLSHERQIHLLHGHEGLPLASTAGGTLRLSTDAHGLAVEADLDPASPWAQSVASAVRRGDAGEMSFGFYVRADAWDESMSHRVLEEVQLDEVSIVRRGANPATSGEMSDTKLEQDAAMAPVDPTPARDIAGALDVRLRFAAIDDV